MGLFSSSTKTYVSSSVYSLAGDEEPTDPLTVAIVGSVMRGSKDIGRDISSSMIAASKYSTSKYYNWAKNSAPVYLGKGDLSAEINADADLVAAEMKSILGLGVNDHVRVYQAFSDTGDIEFFARKWLSENHPTVNDDTWTADYYEDTNEIEIFFVKDDVALSATIAEPADMTWVLDDTITENRRLLYVTYAVTSLDESGQVISVSPLESYIYRIGSGNLVLDGLVSGENNAYEFFPILPIKSKSFFNPTQHPEVYSEIKTGYKKLTGGSITDLITSIKTSPDVDDIDFVLFFSGYPINTDRQEGMEYLFKFFQNLKDKQLATEQDYLALQRVFQFDLFLSDMYDRYLYANDDSISKPWQGPTYAEIIKQELTDAYKNMYGSAPPAHHSEFAKPPVKNKLHVSSSRGRNETTRMTIEYDFIQEKIYPGNAKAGEAVLAKQGEYWITTKQSSKYYFYKHKKKLQGNYLRSLVAGLEQFEYKFTRLEGLVIRHQVNPWFYNEIFVPGLVHKNYVYKGHAVVTNLAQAMASEDDSGFLIPLHFPTVKSMSKKTQARLALSSSYLVFNAYEKVTKKWYQKGFFKVLFSVALIVTVAWITAGAGLGAVPGLLGTNAAVGTALGLSGTAAAVAGAVANALAAVVVTNVVSRVSVEAFGEKWGSVIATIASFVIMNYAVGMNSASGSVNWGDVFSADNLIRLTNTASDAYVKYLQGENLEIQAEIAEARADYEEESAEITEKMAMFENNNAINDSGLYSPFGLLDYGSPGNESRDSQLARTTMVGSDIVQLSHSMIDDFVTISLDLPKAIV